MKDGNLTEQEWRKRKLYEQSDAYSLYGPHSAGSKVLTVYYFTDPYDGHSHWDHDLKGIRDMRDSIVKTWNEFAATSKTYRPQMAKADAPIMACDCQVSAWSAVDLAEAFAGGPPASCHVSMADGE